MKIRKGQKKIKMPPIGLMESVCVKTERGLIAMQHVTFGKAIEGDNETGTPRMWALDGNKLIVRPTPDKATEIYLRFFPPMQEV